MKQFFLHNLDFVFLFYGAAFIFFGTACLVLYFREKTRRVLPWFWLSAFGFLHGINEWLDMLAVSFSNPNFFSTLRIALLTASFVCLFEFARRAHARLKNKVISAAWIYPLITGLILIFFALGKTSLAFSVPVRYFLGFTGAAWTAYIFWIFKLPTDSDVSPRFYKGLAVVFFAYAVATGIIVPKLNIFPAFVVNDANFLSFIHIPIQVFRGFFASAISFLFIYKATKITLYIYGKGRSTNILRLLMSAFFLVYLLCLVFGFKFVSWVEYHERNYQSRMIIADARLVAESLSEADVSGLLESPGKREYAQYRQLHKHMATLADISPFIKSIYLVSLKEGEPNFLVGSQEQVFLKEVSSSVAKNIPSNFILDAFYSRQPTLVGPYKDDKDAELFSVFVPLLSNDGSVCGLLGIDATGFEVQASVMRFRLFAIFIILAFIILVIAGYSFIISFALKSLELEVQKDNLDQALRNLKIAEAELAKSEETFRGILSNSPNAIFGFDRELRVIYWNKGAEKLYGYHKDEIVNEKNPLLSRKITDVCGIEEAALDMERVFSDETFKSEVMHKTKHTSVDVIMTLFPVKDPLGHILFGMGLVQDISDHRMLERQLLEERDRLRAIATSIGAGLSLVGKDFSIIWVNETLEQWFGKLESFKGKKCFEAYHFQDSECEHCPVAEVFEMGHVHTGEQRVLYPDGRKMDFMLICSPVKNERGEVDQVLVLMLDVTERHKMIELLEYERALSKNVINSINDSLIVLDCNSRVIIEANAQFLSEHKLSRDKAIGRRCNEVSGHLCPSCETCNFDDVIRYGKTVSATHIHKSEDGKQIYIDVTMSPLKNEKDELIGLIHLSRDVSERKYLEDELRHYSERLEQLVKERTVALQKSELMFRRLFETAQDGIMIIDAATGHIIDVNPFLLSLLECARDDMQNMHYTKISHLLESHVFERMFNDLYSRLSVLYDDIELKTCTGRSITVEFYATIYYVDDKKIIQCNVRDITERKKMEKIKTEFVSMVSHELRTPLSAIKEGVEIVADGTQGGLNQSQVECLNIALSNIKRLNRLIGDILDISKIQSNLLRVQSTACSVYDLVEHICSLVKVEIEKRGLVFVADVEKDLPQILGDRDRIIQVLVNLSNNAIKFTRGNSKITLSCCRRGDFAEFAVLDQGEGIPAGELLRLFGKFVQLDSTLVRRVGGTGLGLYISKNLVEAMGGQIWAESKIGEGSIFKFTIPIYK